MKKSTKKKMNKPRAIYASKVDSLIKRLEAIIIEELPLLSKEVDLFMESQDDCAMVEIHGRIEKERDDIYLTSQVWLQAGEITQHDIQILAIKERELISHLRKILEQNNPGETE